MKTKTFMTIRHLSCCVIMIFLLLFFSCHKENEQVSTPNPSPSGGQSEPQSGDVIYNAVVDVDGHSYDAVLIGNKFWMIQNLKATRYSNGEEIPVGVPDEDRTDTEPLRFVPNGDGAYVEQYGYLYNWSAVMHGANSSSSNPTKVQGVCPYGWHVPSRAEWEQLTNFIGMQSEYQCNGDRYNVAKAMASTTGWKEASKTCAVGNNQYNNNATHFSAYPAGRGDISVNNNFTKDAYFWTSTQSAIPGWEMYAYDFELDYYSATTYIYAPYKGNAMAVRCVRD